MMTPVSLLAAMVLGGSPAAEARPEAPGLFCAQYPDAPSCAGGAVACAVCHTLSGPPYLNPYGDDVLARLSAEPDFAAELPDVLTAIEALDSDGDGRSNLDEILDGSWPGSVEAIEPECQPQATRGNTAYAVGQYDPLFAWKRITLDFCGRSPRYEEVQDFRAELAALGWTPGDFALPDAPANADDAVVALLHEQLEACLGSRYWDEVLNELGIGVVRPTGYNSDLFILGNYEWDLRLFRYATSGDRDVGDLMQAQYLVVEEPTGSGVLLPIEEPRNAAEAYAQPLAPADRYGLITTRFSLAMNVMFAPVPRTLASHWYRELLGLDMALSEGLYPVDEAGGAYDWDAPRDVDSKGVWQEDCAACHTTTDPLSYPWARYNGIDLSGNTTGTLQPTRATDILPDTTGAIFGVTVSGPAEWVEEAVHSDAFSEHMVELLWTYLLRRAPYTCEADAYTDLWTALRDGSYHSTTGPARNIEAMLHDLVLLEAYGTP